MLVPGARGQSAGGMQWMDPSGTGVDFMNRAEETPGRNIGKYDYFYNGGGVALIDYDHDGWPDLFFTGNDVPNALYRNLGNWKFRDVSEKAGIRGTGKWYTGVTVIDINGDKLPDIYLCCSGPDYRTKSTANELYINNGDGTFSEKAVEYGIADNGLSTQAVFFDMDKDGDDDLWVLNHAVRNLANKENDWLKAVRDLPPAEYRRTCNSLYRNDQGHFTDISKENGLLKAGFGLGMAVSDFTGDGWPDVYICNDYFLPDQFYISNGRGGLREDISGKLPHCSFYSMGCDAADINNDGWIDLAVLDMTPADHYRNKMLMNSMDVPQFRYLTEKLGYLPQYMFNSLWVNNGYGQMSDIAQMAGVHQSDWSWAPLLADFDNDGYRDFFITNGYRRDVKNNDWRIQLAEMMKDPGFDDAMYFDHLLRADSTPIPNQMYRNTDGLKFESMGVQWNMNQNSFSNGAACGDLDMDGDLDIVVNNLDQKAFLYNNRLPEKSGNHFIRFNLKDVGGLSLSNATAEAWYNRQVHVAENHFTRGYQSTIEQILHFGLGQSTQVDSVRISDGRGGELMIYHPDIDVVHSVALGGIPAVAARPGTKPVSGNQPLLFTNRTDQLMKPWYHVENEFDDFAKEVLLPQRMSTLGPGIAVADVDGDGDEDFFVGGAKDQVNSLFLQNSGNGPVFVLSDQAGYLGDSEREVLGALFFDADMDGDKDLYLAHGGGGEFGEIDSLLQDQLLLNDGHGTFSISEIGLPVMLTSTKVLAAADYDGDGDLDLFVGGRNVPGAYPLSPPSYLLRNDGGIFTEDEVWKEQIAQCGMVTDALWMDWEGDGDPDLVVVGEWTDIQVFRNEGGVLHASENVLPGTHTGWWYSLTSGDFDNDGDIDIIAGNLGWNNKFHPSLDKPLDVYANDFDENGTLDIVLSKHYRDRVVPVRGKECSSAQMPYLIGRFPTFDSFASSSLEEIYTREELSKAFHRSATTFTSMYLENRGEGNFFASDLPTPAQESPILSMVTDDFNRDGKLDVLLGGNNLETEVETIPYDAGHGLLLTGRGDGTFDSHYRIDDTGLFIPGDVRQVVPIRLGAEGVRALLVVKNNSRLNVIGVQ